MTNMSNIHKTQERRLVEAAAWRTHLTEMDVESSEAFEAWLAADPQNEVSWRKVQASWGFFGEQATSPELIAARRAALGRARQVGRQRWLAPLSLFRLAGGRGAGRNGAWDKSVARLATAALLVLAIAGITTMWLQTGSQVYRTAAGERRVVTLDDGSVVSLDSKSELRVQYSARARDLTLESGQARFDVAHDVERPFAVTARDRRIVALGTAFNVDIVKSRLSVTLLEGRVAVLPLAPQDETAEKDRRTDTITLNPGQQLVISGASPPGIETASLERVTAWQNGQLIFENEPLSSVVEKVSRYTPRPVAVVDERAAALRISGVFNTGDIEGFVTTIASYLPIEAQSGVKGPVTLRYRD